MTVERAGAMRAFWRGLRRAGGFVAALLRFLGDESPYQRRLESRGVSPSADEWRRYSDARYRARYVKPRCC